MRAGRHRLVGVASRDHARAAAYAREWEIPHAYEHYTALLEDPKVDAVYVPLPNALHAAWTIRAVEHGKHVLCEKPLALSLAEVDAVAAAARAHKRVVAEAFMYRHHPQTRRIRDLVRTGALGTPTLLRGLFTFWLSREVDVRLEPALGGGSLWDIGCYPVSLSRVALGEEPTDVVAWQALGPTGVDERMSAMLRFPGGAVAHVDSSFRSTLRARFDIVGTEATLTVAHPFKPAPVAQLVISRDGHEDRVEDVPGPAPYAGELDDLAAAALDGRDPVVTLDDSRANTRALLACYRSAADGRAVRLADIS